jgi:hypothetical protein
MHTTHKSSGFGIAHLGALVVLIGSVELAWCQTPAAHPSRPALPQSVVVLRSGQVLKGQAALRGDEWVVTVPEGEIRIRTSEVECCCGSIEEAYMRLRAACGLGSVYDHLRLAQWCIRQQLLQQAEQEIAEVAALEPKHPMITAMHRRLEFLRSPPAEVNLTSATSTDVSGADLERLARGLPPGTMESFVRWVQPLVVNNCSTAGCHGTVTDSNFRLSRFNLGEPPSRSVTLRNFHAVLQCVDHDNPAASPLLVAPLRPHGTARAAVFTDPNAGSYARMVEWVYRVTNHPYPGRVNLARTSPGQEAASDQGWSSGPITQTAAAPAPRGPATNTAVRPTPTRQSSGVHRGTHASRSSPSRNLDGGSSGKRPEGNSESAAGLSSPNREPSEDANESSDAEAKPHRPAVQRGAPASATPTADPFDPEVFNRRFGDQSR